MPAIIPLFVGPTSLHSTSHPAPSRITILHLLAATTDGPREAFPGQEYQVDRDRRYDDVSSCRRAYEQKESGDDGCPGLQILEEATSRGVVWYFDSCNQNVQGDANSCPFPADTFRPERDSAKKQTKLICVTCIFPVNRAISIGKLEGNYCNWTMRDSSKLKLCTKMNTWYSGAPFLVFHVRVCIPRIRFECILITSS